MDGGDYPLCMTNEQSATAITASLKWAKKLREAGWAQEASCFYWFEHWQMGIDENGEQVVEPHLLETVLLPNSGGSLHHHAWAAPTAEEILRRLPDILEERFSLIIFRDYNREEKKQEWCLMYEHIPNRMPLYSESADTLANAASAMYVFLSKNNLLPTT
jgi:hypothetical protein